MTRTRAATAAPLPTPTLGLRSAPELEGNRLRLIVERKVFGIRPESGASWLFLSPTTDKADHEAWVRLPLAQAEALERACAAFNVIMDAAERAEQLGPSASKNKAVAAEMPSQGLTPPPAKGETIMGVPSPTAPRAQSIATAAAQVLVLAGILPAVALRCLGLL